VSGTRRSGYAKYDPDWAGVISGSPQAKRSPEVFAHHNSSKSGFSAASAAAAHLHSSRSSGARHERRPSDANRRRADIPSTYSRDFSEGEDDEVDVEVEEVMGGDSKRRPATAGRTRHAEFDDPVFKNWASAVTAEGHVYYYHRCCSKPFAR
jgi:hypothetical protein